MATATTSVIRSNNRYSRQVSVPSSQGNRARLSRQYSRHFSLMSNPIEHWKYIFDQFDKNQDGNISVRELDELIKSREYDHDIPSHVVKKIHELADTNNDGRLDFDEFVTMIQDPALQPIFGTLVNRYVNMVVVPLRSAQNDFEDEFKCCPPPVGMIIISIIELILYFIDVSYGSTIAKNGPVAKALIYNPQRRYEVWRYFTYMLVHIGRLHLIVNLFVQLLLGLPLEMVHRWWRVLIIYFSGVAAGSLGTSIVDPTVKLAGASGGAYAIVTAHIATIIMNWKEMEHGTVQLLILVILTGCDLGSAIHDRHVLKRNEHIGYVAHLAGALAGLLMGINIVRNIKVTRTETIVWWLSVTAYVLLMGIAIVWNIAYTDYFPPQDYT